MSGPTTVLLTTEPTLLLLSAAALRAAGAVRAAQEEADRLHDTHQRSADDNRQHQTQASAQGEADTTRRFTEALARWQRLAEVASRAGLGAALPAPPAVTAASSPAQQVQALRVLEAQSGQLAAVLAAQLPPGTEADPLLETLAGPAQQALAEPLAGGQAAGGARAEALAATVKRLLARLSGPLPEAIPPLVRALADPLPAERAEALLMALRQQVQLAQQAELARAQALVLEHSLRELGYQVEDVADTLFMDGGLLHFTRPGWGAYWVRMRVDARQHTANFNVIRAVSEGENERSVLDHLAEDRWCAEFPALLAALEARGLGLTVTRRLGAGELPVQLVDQAKLPRLAPDEAQDDTQANAQAGGRIHRPLAAAPLKRH